MKETHTDQILKALESGRELTPLDALAEFGCFRLGARIYDLKRRGYNIITNTVKSSNGNTFAGYELVK